MAFSFQSSRLHRFKCLPQASDRAKSLVVRGESEFSTGKRLLVVGSIRVCAATYQPKLNSYGVSGGEEPCDDLF